MKWIGRALVALLLLIGLALAVVYGATGAMLARTHSAEPRSVILSSRPDVLRHGERLAQVYGCYRGCHGPDMAGQVMFDEPWIARISAPSLGGAMRRYSVTELEAIIRQGIRSDGESVLGMPSASFSPMTDQDLSAILSFIRDADPPDSELPPASVRLLGRIGILSGRYEIEAEKSFERPWKSSALATPERRGRYTAILACSECHGLDFGGTAGFAPPLTVAQAYDLEDFRRLMNTGVGLGGRTELGLMSEVARGRFRHLTEEETADLHALLQTL